MTFSLSIYKQFVIVSFLFFFGGILGWIIELGYRRFFDGTNPEHLWLNPGFLAGPCLPVYGFGAAALFALSYIESHIIKFDAGGVKHYVLMFFVMALIMTLIEYIAGVFFIKGMHIKLWDYTNEWGNFQGIICPKYTFFWGVLSAIYYFLLFPPFLKLTIWFIENPWFSFIVGTIFGLFIVDCCFSLKLGTMLRKKAKEIDHKSALNIRQMHKYIRSDNTSKFFSLHDEHFLTNKIDQFKEFIERTPDSINKQQEEEGNKSGAE